MTASIVLRFYPEYARGKRGIDRAGPHAPTSMRPRCQGRRRGGG